ncbi:MAG TPA: UDP-N-acetylmuramoyl-tripeptide--D-alanyl-D-alanine ligase, partial [Acidimicrobiales bacterium]|nr:UDP-N-acetylmuramoyl-tripeptide--D-alanyl-D-alanine ligase [Acidimicrobiales bacterium]
MRFSAAALATTVGGTLAGPDVPVDGVATDTRELRRGQLFVPLVDRRDGHQFLAAAVAAGAPAYLTTGPTVPGATAVQVADTAVALLSIGRAARDRLGDRVVGVTGSVGKTTVKDLVAGALATTFVTAGSPLSFNNEIGVPLTLANAEEGTEATVVEMGARGEGHIRALCLIARPTVGIVTRVGLAHTEQLGDLKGVAAAKAELVESLPRHGTAVLNADDPLVLAMGGRTSAAVRTFGLDADADVRATDVALDDLARPSFRLVSPEGSAPVRLGLHGPHQVPNALAAAAAALVAGVPVAAVAGGLEGVGPPRWRMSVLATRSGATVVNDAYNANPT